MTIFEADPSSGVSRAYAALARKFAAQAVAAAGSEAGDAAASTSGQSEPGTGRRLRLLRKGN